jgi:RNA 2',3'-cyclic 3'-phosphodiesterase
LFLALNLPAEVRSRSFEVTSPLRGARPDVKWVPEEKLHLTLKFLGERGEELVPTLSRAMDRVAAGTRPLDIAFGAVGGFPTLRRARVVYLAVAPDPKLELLHHDVELACAELGLPIEGKPFRPHVTLGREREVVGVEERRALREAARQVRVREHAPVASLDLMASEGGSRYRLVHAASFRTD